MNEYLEWCEREIGSGPKNIRQVYDQKLGRPVFLVENAYTRHWRSSENVDAMVGYFRRSIPREIGFSLYFGGSDASLDAMDKLTPPISFGGTMENLPCQKGDTVKLFAHGEQLTLEQEEKMGWVLACMLGDKSFYYTITLPQPETKYTKLKELISPFS